MGYTDRREVRQFQYTAWPDHGVPDYPGPFLQFLRRINTMNPPDAGPMITHCSAGVGRTGAFIVIGKKILSHLDRFGFIWTNLDQFGAIWTHLVPFGLLWTNLVPFGPI